MAPSKETSCEGNLPVALATPIRAVAKLLQKLSIHDKGSNEDNDDSTSGYNNPVASPSHLPTIAEEPPLATLTFSEVAAQQTVEQLSETQLGFLLNNAPPPADFRIPNKNQPIKPMESLHSDALAIEPQTDD